MTMLETGFTMDASSIKFDPGMARKRATKLHGSAARR